MTPQEYLEWEEQQPIKYEYIKGEFYAMTTAILPHNSIASNLASALKKIGLELEGTHHRGIDDARNIARIVQAVLS